MLEKLIKWNSVKIAKWEKTRSRGRKRFILVRGVAGWGLLMFLFMTVLVHFRDAGFKLPALEDISMVTILINAVVWPIAGYVWGAWTWSLTEKSYIEHANKNSNNV